MQASERPTERIDLRFRAEPAKQSLLPGGALLWILSGLAIGFGAWFVSQQMLRQSLRVQLASAPQSGDAYVALESLMQLNGTSPVEVVSGLENPNRDVARSAFKALDQQVTKWKEDNSLHRLDDLADRLLALPESTRPENLMLASSLAARIFAHCLSEENPDFEVTLRVCQQVVARSGTTLGTPSGTLDLDAGQVGLAVSNEPPPPLPPQNYGQPAKSLADQYTAGMAPAEEQPLPATEVQSPEMASIRLVPFRNSNLRPSAPPEQDSAATFSLSDAPEPLTPEPVVAQNVGDNATVPMRISPVVELGGLENRTNKELFRMLGSVQTKVSQGAMLELRHRNFTDAQLELAIRLATSPEAERLQIVHEIATNRELNPRWWLLWMAEDGQPVVRKTAVSLLHTMVDEEVAPALMDLLRRESDESVTQAIRQALAAAPGSQLRG